MDEKHFPANSVLQHALRTYIRYYNATRLHSSLDLPLITSFERERTLH